MRESSGNDAIKLGIMSFRHTLVGSKRDQGVTHIPNATHWSLLDGFGLFRELNMCMHEYEIYEKCVLGLQFMAMATTTDG